MPRSTTKSLIHDEAILRQLRLGASWAAVPATVRPLSSWPPPTGGAPREPIGRQVDHQHAHQRAQYRGLVLVDPVGEAVRGVESLK